MFKFLFSKFSRKTATAVSPMPTRIMVRLTFPGVQTLTLLACTSEDLYDALLYNIMTNTDYSAFFQPQALANRFTLYYGLKPLSRRSIPLTEYNIRAGDSIVIAYTGLLGGALTPLVQLPTYTHVLECENQLLEKFQLQTATDDSDASNTTSKIIDYCFGKHFPDFAKNIGDQDYMNKLMEDIFYFISALFEADEYKHYQRAVISFLKFRSQKAILTMANVSLLTDFVVNLFTSDSDFETQSMESVFSMLKTGLGKFEELKKSPVYKKIYQLMMFTLSFSIFDQVGAVFGMDTYWKMERTAFREKMNMGPTFIHSIITTIIFVCERGYQCLKTGSLDPIFHSGTQYEKWYDSAMEVKRRSTLLSCPEAHGFSLFEFLADLSSIIEKGESIAKHAIRIGDMERKMVLSVLNDLKMIKADQTTKREAQKERTAPFSICLYGGSSIGKTTITDMLFFQYGKTFDLPIDSEFKYTRNPNAKFWDGFSTSQWFVIMDDVAFMNPDIASAGDPSVMETIQTNNRVSFVPDQASLDDKGRTPFKARCVVATTNCEDLNAIHYFQTPLAMQRRFPFTIDVTVKDEFAKDVCMLDSSKTQLVNGEWPDYWNFHVKRPVPIVDSHDNRRGQRAMLETVEKFTDVNDFLAWFSIEAVKHERIQKLVENGSNSMKKIELCKKCFRNLTKCTCIEIQSRSSIKDAISYYGLHLCLGAANNGLLQSAVAAASRNPSIVRGLENALLEEPHLFRDQQQDDLANEATERGLLFCEDLDAPQTLRARFFQLGNLVQQKIGWPKLLGITVLACGTMLGAYKAYQSINKMFNPLMEQGSADIGSAPAPTHDEKSNVWKHDEHYEMSAFDMSARAICMKGYDRKEFIRCIQNNLIAIRAIRKGDDGLMYENQFKAICLGGHIYVCNSHSFKGDNHEISIVASPDVEGINGNSKMLLPRSMIKYFDNDLCAFKIDCLPPRKNICDLFVSAKNNTIQKGYMLQRTNKGSIEELDVACYKRIKHLPTQSINVDVYWEGRPTRPTVVGECGSLHIAETNMGPQILGIHVAGNSTYSAATLISSDLAFEVFKYFDAPIVTPRPPAISGESKNRVLGPLHPRSSLRWMSQGTGAIYGSFEGWRATRKSTVKPTVLLEAIKEEGYSIKHGVPVMAGREPWSIAVTDMLQPVTGLNPQILEDCKNSFLNDILTGLPDGALDTVMVYDNDTAINGADGVAFVDKMNRNTSMGAPYNKGKRHFLVPLSPESDRMTFVPEIMDRVDDIIDGYMHGERYMPVFTGTLKDEALPFKKIVSKKTRVFTAAPADWSLVVRKYLLSVIRLIQTNKFIFETAVGTNAASTQWQDIREYLVQHGCDNMIAGDYGRFDKTMPPSIILAAYDILRLICKAAGYSENELLVIQGIAEDTAFPLVDFNGDLVEFYGSNPSGHPLTVIINSLANSLYMRYCYAELSPNKTCDKFKKDVALMTYGDDNAMGVSRSASFFNHTAIQKVLSDVGITYTMADKEAVSIPFIHIDDISFLKRLWRWDNDVKAYLAPLEEDSIIKSLTMNTESKTLCDEAHAIATLESAHSEYFFHGRQMFDTKIKMIQRLVTKCNLEVYVRDNSFPTWEQLRQRFINNSQ